MYNKWEITLELDEATNARAISQYGEVASKVKESLSLLDYQVVYTYFQEPRLYISGTSYFPDRHDIDAAIKQL